MPYCATGLCFQYQKNLFAEAAGVQYIPAEELQEKYAAKQEEASAESECESVSSAEDSNRDAEEEEASCDLDQVPINSNAAVDPNKRGTEVKLHNLQLRESAATMTVTSVAMVIQCARCKNTTEITTPPNRLNSVSCTRCNGQQLVTFRGSMVHQFQSVLGYLDLVECTAFDVVLSQCHFMIGCLGCSKEMAMLVNIYLLLIHVFTLQSASF